MKPKHSLAFETGYQDVVLGRPTDPKYAEGKCKRLVRLTYLAGRMEATKHIDAMILGQPTSGQHECVGDAIKNMESIAKERFGVDLYSFNSNDIRCVLDWCVDRAKHVSHYPDDVFTLAKQTICAYREKQGLIPGY